MRLHAFSLSVLLAFFGQAPFMAQQQDLKPPATVPMTRITPDAAIPVSLEPGAGVVDEGVWTREAAGTTVLRIDAKSNLPGNTTPAGPGACASVVQAFESVWVPLCGEGSLLRLGVKPDTAPVRSPVKPAAEHGSIAAGVGSMWMATGAKGVVSRIDPATNSVVAEIYVPAGPSHVTFDKDAVFVTSTGGTLTRINAHTNVVEETIKVGSRPGPIAVGEGAVWVLNRADRSVTRVDRDSGKVIATIATGAGEGEGAIAAGEGGVWVSVQGTPVIRIDPRSNRVTHRFAGEGGGAILVGHGSIWVNAGPKTTWRIDPMLVSALRP